MWIVSDRPFRRIDKSSQFQKNRFCDVIKTLLLNSTRLYHMTVIDKSALLFTSYILGSWLSNITNAVFTRDIFTWGKLTFLSYCVTFCYCEMTFTSRNCVSCKHGMSKLALRVCHKFIVIQKRFSCPLSLHWEVFFTSAIEHRHTVDTVWCEAVNWLEREHQR